MAKTVHNCIQVRLEDEENKDMENEEGDDATQDINNERLSTCIER